MMNEIAKAFVRFMNDPRETFNPVYEPYEKEIFPENGTKRFYGTDQYINGAYFKSKNKNNYYLIVPSNMTLKEIMENNPFERREFRSAPRLLTEVKPKVVYKNMRTGFDPNTECLIKLEIEDDKPYFVENYQCISAPKNARITIISDITSESVLIQKLMEEEFVPIPSNWV